MIVLIRSWKLAASNAHPSDDVGQLAAIAVDGGIEISAFEQKIRLSTKQTANPATLASPKIITRPRRGMMKFRGWPLSRTRRRGFVHIARLRKSQRPASRIRSHVALDTTPTLFDWPRLRALFRTRTLPVDCLVRDVLQRVLFYADENGESAAGTISSCLPWRRGSDWDVSSARRCAIRCPSMLARASGNCR